MGHYHHYFSSLGGILALIRQAQGLNPNPEEESALKKLTSHVPGIVTFADHNKALPWSSRYSTVLMFADISGNKSNIRAIVEGIVNSEGDVLKFAGDAILAVWRVNTANEMSAAVAKVVRCCLDIQSKCGEWKTDIGVTLTVKMGGRKNAIALSFITKSSLMSKESTDVEQKKFDLMAVKERLKDLKEKPDDGDGSDSVQAVPTIQVESDSEAIDKSNATSDGNENDSVSPAASTEAKPKLSKAFGSKLGKGGIARWIIKCTKCIFQGCTFLVIFGLPGFKHERDCAHALICSYKMHTILKNMNGVIILRARTHGVPFWCEQLLIDMASRKQIVIVDSDGDLKMLENSISPNKDQILRLANHDQFTTEEAKRKNSFFLTTNIENIKSDESTSDFLADLGYVHNKPTKTSVTERVAIFAPGIIPEEIPIPPSMNDLIMARLDSMRATDQLVVKCATVLGKSFTRDMLETVLPKVQRVKARKSFKRLHESGIFECATAPSMRHRQATGFRRDSLLREGCYCSRVDIGIGENVCDNMRFKNLLLRDTAYQILMESQRKELHEKAAQYLEKQADDFRNNIPYFILERDPPSTQEACQVTVSVRRPFYMSNRITDSHNNQAGKYLRQRRRRRAIVSTNEVIGPLLRKLLEAITTDNATEALLKDLLPLYNDIIFHWKAADKMLHVIDLLLEAISVALAIGNTAMTHYLSDESETAFKYMSEAMSLLGLKEASDTCKDKHLLRRERIKLFFIRMSTKERNCAHRKDQLTAGDFYKVGKIYAETSAASFQTGELARALSTGAPVETLTDTLAFATDYMQFADAVAGEYTTRYYLAMSIAALHARKKNWKESQRWFNYWEIYESQSSTFPSSFLYGHARLRKLEVMLLSYCTNKQLGQYWSVKRLEAEIKLEFQALKKIRKSNKSTEPRLHHVKAYFDILRGKTFRAHSELFKSIRCSRKQKNKFELEWAVHNRKLWLSRVRSDDKWITFSNQHIYEMNVSTSLKRTIFTLPR
ncbi:hypothetical protein KUTeg_004880 [Tegillarca granosa]|uniref:Guanylate cyclase domain-containing protein n=1 Tax=Tegillarca granosa TaxID=220873 RepID=A0ABQ9FLC8_TEGGR|nr:hypothetical protein KUTeg_004880 [Tegillarca granosa]